MRANRRSRGFVVLVGLLSLLAAACGASASAAGPPDIKYGRDVCVECSMVISEPRFAAAYRLDDGTEKKFDDIGGMIKHGSETGETSTATAWVHDFQTEAWIDATAAFYVPTRSVATPMAHGVVAFSEEQRAIEFAEGVGGEVIDWDTLLGLPIVDGLVGHHHEHASDTGDDEQMHNGEMENEEANHDGMEDHDMEGET